MSYNTMSSHVYDFHIVMFMRLELTIVVFGTILFFSFSYITLEVQLEQCSLYTLLYVGDVYLHNVLCKSRVEPIQNPVSLGCYVFNYVLVESTLYCYGAKVSSELFAQTFFLGLPLELFCIQSTLHYS